MSIRSVRWVVLFFFVLTCVAYAADARKKNKSRKASAAKELQEELSREDTVSKGKFTKNIRHNTLCDAASNELVVCSWNVENLFDAEDDCDSSGDDEYVFTTKENQWRRWTAERYAEKCERLAEIIAYMKPDILCLAELENHRVLEDLIKTLKEKQNYDMPYIVHRESPDMRGIDVGMISRIKPEETYFISNGPGRREAIAADFKKEGRVVTVFMNHWKSKLGKKEASDKTRFREAEKIRKALTGRLQKNPAAAIVFAGDFNDNPDCPQLTQGAQCWLDRDAVASPTNSLALYNVASALEPLLRATYYYMPSDEWSAIDSMSVSRGMLPEVINHVAPWVIKDGTYQVVLYPKHVSSIGSPIPYRWQRSKIHQGYYAGYSDHFPIRLILKPRGTL